MLAAADFIVVDLPTLQGVVRYLVFFVIALATRTVKLAGIAADPGGTWVTQCIRNLRDRENGFLRGKRFLIHDRDPLYLQSFADALKAVGIEALKLPARSPNLNAFAERFVRSIRSEYLVHYNAERPHQGVGNELLTHPEHPPPRIGRVRCKERLGGLLRFYHRGDSKGAG